MQGPCEHCSNKDKSKWTTDCKYKGDWPSRRAFVLSTFDPPCSSDDYDESMRELARSKSKSALISTILIVSVLALLTYLMSR